MKERATLLEQWKTSYGIMQKGRCNWCSGRLATFVYIDNKRHQLPECGMCNGTGVMYRLLKKSS